jgi:hypothetical protein
MISVLSNVRFEMPLVIIIYDLSLGVFQNITST